MHTDADCISNPTGKYIRVVNTRKPISALYLCLGRNLRLRPLSEAISFQRNVRRIHHFAFIYLRSWGVAMWPEQKILDVGGLHSLMAGGNRGN